VVGRRTSRGPSTICHPAPPCHPGLRAGISDHRRPFNIIEAPDLEIPALRFAPAGMTRKGGAPAGMTRKSFAAAGMTKMGSAPAGMTHARAWPRLRWERPSGREFSSLAIAAGGTARARTTIRSQHLRRRLPRARPAPAATDSHPRYRPCRSRPHCRGRNLLAPWPLTLDP